MLSRIVSNDAGCSSRKGPQGLRKRLRTIIPAIASIHAGVACIARRMHGPYWSLPWSDQPRACTRRRGRLSALVRLCALPHLPLSLRMSPHGTQQAGFCAVEVLHDDCRPFFSPGRPAALSTAVREAMTARAAKRRVPLVKRPVEHLCALAARLGLVALRTDKPQAATTTKMHRGARQRDVDLHLGNGHPLLTQMLHAIGETYPAGRTGHIYQIPYGRGRVALGVGGPVEHAPPARPGLHGAEPDELAQVQLQARLDGDFLVGAKVARRDR